MDVDTIRVDLFGQECNTGTPDADGNVWNVETIAGWDAPDQRTQTEDPTGMHGSYVTALLAAGRDIVVTGWVDCATQASGWAVYNRIAGSLPGILGSGDVVVHEPDVAKSLTVVRPSKPRITEPIKGLVNFQLSLLAEYPWKRAVDPVAPVTIPAGDTVTITHSGTFAAEFTATTTSSGTVRLASAGLQLECASVPSGTVFDSQEFTVTDSGGTDLYGLIEPGSEWPAVSVGAVDWINAGTADVELSYFPTYA